MTTLSYSATDLTLPDAVLWADELDWHPVQERRRYSVTGALLVDVGVKQAGRPITLSGWWLSRGQVAQLRAWAALPAASFTLVLRGDNYTVRFDHEQPPLLAEPLHDIQDPNDGTVYAVTARFIEI